MQFNKALKNIKNYEAGKPVEFVVREYGLDSKDIIKLASNENPRGCSPKVIEVLSKSLQLCSLYPDDSMYELKEGLSRRFDVKEQNVIVGAGSDQVIEFAIRSKANRQKGILTAGITFAMYEIYATRDGIKTFKTSSKEHNLDEFLSLYKEHKDEIGVVFLCLPNNPLGECLDKDKVYEFLSCIDADTLVVIDGAYQEYAGFKDEAKKIEPKDLMKHFPNTLFLGTFSKAYGLGGLRIGYGIAKEEIIGNLYKLRAPFNISSISLKAACTALKDDAFVRECLDENFSQMKRYEEFAKKNSIKYIKSYTNFITFLMPEQKNSTFISNLLLKKGIIVRDLASYGLNAIRITVGLPTQNDRVFEIFNDIIR